jgi:hypothetical protein
MKIYYTKKINKDIEEELQKQECRDALTKYRNRTFGSLNIHKLKNFGNNIYTMYINIADRIIFHRDQIGSINVLDVVRSHRYESSKAKGFDITSLLKADVESFTKFSDINDNEKKTKEDEEEDFFQNLEEEMLYNRFSVTLSDFQNEAINEVRSHTAQLQKLPLLISGAPGSGKTLVAREMLIKYVDAKKQEMPYDDELDGKNEVSAAAPDDELDSSSDEDELDYVSDEDELDGKNEVSAAAPDDELDSSSDEDELDSSVLDKQIIAYYIAPSKYLRDKMSEAISELPDADQYSKHIKIISYKKFIRGCLEIDKEVVNISCFESWYNENKKTAFKKGMQLDVKDLYHELSILVAVGSENYKTLGINQSSLKEQASRKSLCTLYNEYTAYLNGTNKVDLALYKMQATKKLEGSCLLILDESQTYTHCQLLNMQKIFKMNAVYLGDSNQSMMSAVSYSDYLKTLYYNKDSKIEYLNVKEWSYSYRCPEMIVGFADEIRRLKHQIFSNRHTRELKTSGDKKIGGVYVLDKEEQNSILEVSSVDVAYIVFTQEEKEALKKQNIHHIFLPEEILGLEYKHVVLYNMFNIEGLKKLVKYNENGKLLEKSPETVGSNEQILLLNKLFVSITRTTNNIYIIEPSIDLGRVSPLLQHLEIMEKDAKSRRTQQLDIKAIKNSTNAELFNYAISLIKKGKKEQAEGEISYLESKLKSDKIFPLFNTLLNISDSTKTYQNFKVKYNILMQIKAIIDNGNSQLNFHMFFKGYDYMEMFKLAINEFKNHNQETEVSEESKQFIDFLMSNKNTKNSLMKIIYTIFDFSTCIEKYIFDTYLKNKIKAELLSSAVGHKNHSLVNLLIAEPYNVNLLEALYFAVINGNKRVAEMLIKNPYNVIPSESLKFAVKNGLEGAVIGLIDCDIVKPSQAFYFALLYREKVLVELINENYSINYREVLFIAIADKKTDLANYLISRFSINTSEALYYSIKKDLKNITIWFFKYNLVSQSEALFFALLLDKEGLVNALVAGSNGANSSEALYYAINNDSKHVIIDKLMAAPFSASTSEALYYAVRDGNSDVKNKLILRPYHANPLEALYFAVRNDNDEVANELISNHKADSAKALYIAVKNNDHEVAKKLSNYGADVSGTLYWAFKYNDQDRIDQLKAAPYNAKLSEAIYYVAKNYKINNVYTINFLVSSCRDVSISLEALYLALKNDNYEAANILSEYRLGASKALYLAIKDGKDELVALLMSYSKVEKSEALYFAIKDYNQQVQNKLIKNHGANISEALYFAIADDNKQVKDELIKNHGANLLDALYFAILKNDTILVTQVIQETYQGNVSQLLFNAVKDGKDEVAKKFKDSYAASPVQAFCLAISQGNRNVANKLIDNYQVNISKALCYAMKSMKKIAKILCSDYRAIPGEALYFAVRDGKREIKGVVKELTRHPYNAVFSEALYFAVCYKDFHLVGVLKGGPYFANPFQAAAIAGRYGNEEVKNILNNSCALKTSESLYFSLINGDNNDDLLNKIIDKYDLRNNQDLLDEVKTKAEKQQHVLNIINAIESKIAPQGAEPAGESSNHVSIKVGGQASPAGEPPAYAAGKVGRWQAASAGESRTYASVMMDSRGASKAGNGLGR